MKWQLHRRRNVWISDEIKKNLILILKGLTVLPINNEFMIIDDIFRYGNKVWLFVT